MENFIYRNTFYSSIEDLLPDLDIYEKEDALNLSNDYYIECVYTELQPIVTLSPDWITDRIDDERLSENNSDNEINKITSVLQTNIDFDKINALLPKLHYTTKNKFKITKVDILDYL